MRSLAPTVDSIAGSARAKEPDVTDLDSEGKLTSSVGKSARKAVARKSRFAGAIPVGGPSVGR